MTAQQKTASPVTASISGPSGPAAFDAAIFDLDGTLVNTERLFNETGLAACAEAGAPVSAAFFDRLTGIDDETRVKMISEEAGRPLDKALFYAIWDRLSAEAMAGTAPLMPGVTQTLERLAAHGLPMAICTSSRRNMAELKVANSGLAHFFAHVVSVDDVTDAKPHPAPYLEAARRLGADPARCLAFGDSNAGALSAFRAGMTVVQVPDTQAASGEAAHVVAETLPLGLDALDL